MQGLTDFLYESLNESKKYSQAFTYDKGKKEKIKTILQDYSAEPNGNKKYYHRTEFHYEFDKDSGGVDYFIIHIDENVYGSDRIKELVKKLESLGSKKY